MVSRLFLNRSGALSGMREENLRKWLWEATQEEAPYATHWHNLLVTLQAALRDRTLAGERMWQKMVLIPKGDGGDFRGIGLVEVLCKTATGLLNHCFTLANRSHEVLHGFRAVHRTGTATLEAKLLQHLTDIREAVLYDIFLNLNKVYADLD